MGRRLGEYTRENTKCMVEVNGVPLIDRLLSQLSGLGLSRVVIVAGYKGDRLKAHVGDRYGSLKVEYVDNPVYDRTNNIYSLALAQKQLQEDDTILVESDLILDDGIFSLLMASQAPNVALVARFEGWMDGTMVSIDDDSNITNFIPKSAFDYAHAHSYYKTVNVYKFSREFSRSKYVPFLEAYLKVVGNSGYYENVLRVLTFLNNCDLKALPVDGVKWYEIDDKQDLDIAEALFAEEKDVIRKYYGRFGGYWRFPKMLDFCYLINPFFPSSRILDEMQANFRTLLTQYPSGMKVNSLLASKCWGIRQEYVIPGNGAAELIKHLMDSLGGTLGIVRPTFEEYPNRRDASSLVTFVPDNEDFRYTAADLEHFFGEHPADAILLINPDNPSGNFIAREDVLHLASWCETRGCRLVVDESFVDFSDCGPGASLLSDEILEGHPGLVVVKSISKSYGVPGLRLGLMASSDTELIASLKKKVSIWNINSFAEFFMQILDKYEADYLRACAKFVEERADLEARLRAIPFLRVMPSQANYFLCEVLPPHTAAGLVVSMLKKHDVLVRDCSSKSGFRGKQYLRLAVRSHDDNSRLVEALLDC